MATSTNCTAEGVYNFGPATTCPGVYDFTLLFEELILTIVPNTIAGILIPHYLRRLLGSDRKVTLTWHLTAKNIIWIVLCLANAVQFGLTSRLSTTQTTAAIATCVTTIAVHIALALLSHFAHLRTVKPSSPVVLFLLLTVVFDTARCRTLWNLGSDRNVAAVMTVAVVLKAILLALESKEKRTILFGHYRASAPECTAGLLNQWFCWWLNPLLVKGYRQMHSLETLLEVDTDLYIQDKDDTRLSEFWLLWKSRESNHALLLASLTHNKRAIGKAVLPRLMQTGFSFSQPFLVKRVIEYIESNDATDGEVAGAGLIMSYLIVYVGIALATSVTQQWANYLVTRIRAGLIDLIYAQTLKIQCLAVDEADSLTLMSTDVERISTGLRTFHELWACPIEIALSLWLLSDRLRVAAAAPAVVIVLFTGTAIVVASKVGIAQKAWIDKIQLRISATASLLGAMTPIKMTGLTQSLSRKIRKLRENEIKSSYGYRVVLMCIVSLTFASTALTPVASFGVYILLQQYRGYAILDPTITLTTLTLIQLLLAPVSILIDALSGLTSAMGCLERIRQYLLSETRVDGRIVKRPVTERMWNNHESIGNLMRSSSSRRVSAIELRPIAPRRYSNRGLQLGEINSHRDSAVFYRASFGWKGGEKPILKELSLKLPKGKLTMVVGPVGSGKSTFLQTLLGETQSSGDGGYIQVSFEDAAYCQQRPWISNQTIRQNILGCFGFDPEWYYEVIQACCLARDLDLLPEGDVTKVGSHGASLSGGQQARIALARAIYSKKKTMILDDVLSGLDASTIDAVFSSLFAWDGLLRRHKVTVVLATNDVHLLPSSDHIIVLGSNGAITEQGSFGTLYSRSGYISGLNLQKLPHDGRTKNGGDGPEHGSLATNEALARALPQLRAPDGVSGGELATYKYYIESFGWVRWWIFISICSFYGFGVCFPHAWAQMWATHNIQYPGDKAGYYIGIYFLIAALTVLSLGAGCGFLVLGLAPRVAKTMHSRVLTAVMNAPIALFSQVDAGSLINRFSQDMELIDMELPVSLIHTVLMVFVLTAQTLVIVSTAKYAGVALPACGLAAYLTQKYYLRTSRALRLLDIEAKSLLFSHFLETLAGLVTIRAFRWTDSYSKTNADRINVSQRPAYLLLCVQRWLGLVLDLLVSAIAVILAAIAVKTRGQIDAGVMGLALLNVVGFSTTLKQLITNWTLLETSTGALSRVKSFTESVDSELADEKPQNFYQHVAAWPWHMLTSDPRPGIIFNEVTSSYTKFSKPVLNNVSIWIEPGQRIGVCGRSGSGKSSLLASLLRMTHIQSGSIVIDGIDISNLTPEQVRLRFNTLPQQPFLLHGTIRENIDPLDEHEFDAIVEALDLVGLRDLLLTDLGLEGGLDAPMPINVLSHGQSQLLCLARALVRRDRSDVLILDEATASVDAGTEALMQQLIADKFRGKTIIAVAHRLNTIIDYDRIAVLDDGVLVEWDRPSTLLQQDSYFRRLYKDSGASFE